MKKTIAIVLAILILIPNITVAASTNSIPSTEKEPDLYFFVEVFQYIKERYPFEVENKHLLEGALKGMLQSLDPYSDYYTPDEATDLYKEMFGIFSGIGVYIEEKDSYINIKDTIKGSPAEKAGLKKNDLIVLIDGKDTKNFTLDEAKKLIQGTRGTKVKLGIKRNNSNKIITIEVERDTFNINPVDYEILENNIGYIKLTSFTQTASKEIKKALVEMDSKNVKNLILDLRDNGGGLLPQAVEISRLFVPKGPIVHIRENGKEILTHLSTLEDPKYNLVLLVNENSASASEILAGAVKDTKAGTIIGKKTFGKGLVQTMMPLANGSILKMTTAYYLTPNKTSIQGIGVEPDIVVEQKENEDTQLKKAKAFFKGKN